MCGIMMVINLTPRRPMPSEYRAWLFYLASKNADRGLDVSGSVVYRLKEDGTGLDPRAGTHFGQYGLPPLQDIQDALDLSTSGFDSSAVSNCLDQLYDPFAIAMWNFRGVPTTEIPQGSTGLPRFDRDEMQPFSAWDGAVSVIHNGIISNDRSINASTPAIGRLMSRHNQDRYAHDIDSYSILRLYLDSLSKPIDMSNSSHVGEFLIQRLEGSFAFALVDAHSDRIIAANNFLGLNAAIVSNEDASFVTLVFSSEPIIVGIGRTLAVHPLRVDSNNFPYYRHFSLSYRHMQSIIEHGYGNEAINQLDCYLRDRVNSFLPIGSNGKAAVVLSGGLDSTTVAHLVYNAPRHEEIHLIHFNYGCHATGPEAEAIERTYRKLTEAGGKKIVLQKIDLPWLNSIGGSTLTALDDQTVAGGDTGAETVSEWVPARNLLFISMVAAYCDANNIKRIFLGLNREEASVFNDNSSEFYQALNNALALGTQSQPAVICPLGNRMKHHIVRIASALPTFDFNDTWSCYKSHKDQEGKYIRCGTCGPCRNTARALHMAQIADPFTYEVQPLEDLQNDQDQVAKD